MKLDHLIEGLYFNNFNVIVNPTELIYINKTIIINIPNFDKKILKELSRFNTIITRTKFEGFESFYKPYVDNLKCLPIYPIYSFDEFYLSFDNFQLMEIDHLEESFILIERPKVILNQEFEESLTFLGYLALHLNLFEDTSKYRPFITKQHAKIKKLLGL